MRHGRGRPAAALALALTLAAAPLFAASPGGLSFDDAARLAVAASLELRNAYATSALQEGAWKLGARAYFPKLSLAASESDRLSLSSTDSFTKNYSLTLEQLVWDGGRLAMSRQMERAQLDLGLRQIDRQALAVADAAISAYRQVLYVRATLAIQEAACESLQKQRDILAQEVALGAALPMSLTEAELTLAQTKIEIINVGIELQEAEQSLADTLGLDTLPPLTEEVDVRRSARFPSGETVRALALGRSPQLEEARFSLAQQEVSLKTARLAWLPTIQMKASAGLTGERYPLSKHNWAVSLNMDFSSPWLSGSLGGSAGWEAPSDYTAAAQSSLNPVPDLSGALSVRQAELALRLGRESYRDMERQLGRAAESALEKCGLLEKKRGLALESAALEAERYRLSELRLSLGQITRLDLMEARQDLAKADIAVVEAAVSLLEAERQLETLLDLPPGGLAGLLPFSENP